MIVAETRSRAVKRNDSCVAYSSGFGLLQKIIVLEEPQPQCYLLIKQLTPSSTCLSTDDVTNIELSKHFHAFCPLRFVTIAYAVQHAYCYMYTLYSSSVLVAVPVEKLSEKCVFLNMEKELNNVFISQFPNTTEVE